MTARAWDLERELAEIALGQRQAAEVREAEADRHTFAGDEAGAERLRATARHLRAAAAETVRGLAKLRRERVTAPAYLEQTAMIQRLAAAAAEARREREAESAKQREARVVARRQDEATKKSKTRAA